MKGIFSILLATLFAIALFFLLPLMVFQLLILLLVVRSIIRLAYGKKAEKYYAFVAAKRASKWEQQDK